MDEEELQQTEKKIDIDSFFNRVDAVEGVASNALKQSNLNTNAIQANKTLINSISVTIEAMRTEIRDIANYIVIENKLEKDKRDDEKFEAEDQEQKANLADRLKAAAQGPVTPKDMKTGAEDDGGKKTGGGFLGGLFKVVGGLGLAAGLIALSPFIAKALVIGGAGLLLAMLVAKIRPFIVKFLESPMKYIASAIRNTLGKIPLIKGPALAWADSIDSGAEKIGKNADSELQKLEKSGEGEPSSSEISVTTGGGDGELTEKDKEDIKKEDELESFLSANEEKKSNMSLENKNVEDSSENILDSVDAEEDSKMKKKKKRKISKEKIIEMSKEYKALVEKNKTDEGLTRRELNKLKKLRIILDKIGVETRDITLSGGATIEDVNKAITTINPEAKEAPRFGDVGGLIKFEDNVSPENENANINDLSSNRFNNNNNVKNQRMQLDSQVSSAEIKGTGTNIRAVRMTSNQFLSTHDKNIPIEVLRAIA